MEIVSYWSDDIGKIGVLTFRYKQETYCVINIYMYTADKEKEQISLLQQLAKIIEDNLDKTFIVGGDFNLLLNPLLDKYNCNSPKESKSVVFLKQILQNLK